jgi:hypothetical protein
MKDAWEHLEHGADVGVRGIGTSKAAAIHQPGSKAGDPVDRFRGTEQNAA